MDARAQEVVRRLAAMERGEVIAGRPDEGHLEIWRDGRLARLQLPESELLALLADADNLDAVWGTDVSGVEGAARYAATHLDESLATRDPPRAAGGPTGPASSTRNRRGRRTAVVGMPTGPDRPSVAEVADPDLTSLVRRRLFELNITAEQASRLSHWAVAPETIEHLAAGRRSGLVSDRLADALARALGVPENRVRRAAGLPEIPDPRESIETTPQLRLIKGGGSSG